MANITDIDELLGREAELAAQQLGNGLTCLRKYNFSYKGYFYAGLFSITIGLERVLKLIILLDYVLTYNKHPDNGFLKSKKHEIKGLLREAIKINNDRNLGISEDIIVDELGDKIIEFLSDFAMKSRYYNLDTASGLTHASNEPLARWDAEICSIIIKRHSKKTKSKEKVMALKQVLKPAHVHHIHEDGSIINNIDSYLKLSADIDEKQKYSVLYLYKIIRFAVKVLNKLDRHDLREFFTIFTQSKDSYVLKKKTFDPYKL